MSRDEMIAQITSITSTAIDRAYEAGWSDGYEAGREWLDDPEEAK